jgi:hypothetical protein
LVATFVVAASLIPAYLINRYMTEYSRAGLSAVVIVVLGLGAGIIVWLILRRVALKWISAALVLCLLAVASIPVSIAIGRVTYSRFGLTVYGVLPIPILDLQVSPTGVLGFRDKTHLITVEEVNELVMAGADVIILGTGWHEAVAVDDSVFALPNVSISVYPTPQAFAEYNRLRAQGVKVALLAHSTC